MFMYPPGVQMVIYKQQEKDLLRSISQPKSAKEASRPSVSVISGIFQFLNVKLFHAHPA
jgi:hypothetical protein